MKEHLQLEQSIATLAQTIPPHVSYDDDTDVIVVIVMVMTTVVIVVVTVVIVVVTVLIVAAAVMVVSATGDRAGVINSGKYSISLYSSCQYLRTIVGSTS